MFKKKLIMMVASILFTLLTSPIYAYQSHYGPTELTYYDKSKAFNGYTLFSSNSGQNSFLIDMEGSLVHSWKRPDDYSFEKHAYLLENGNILWGLNTGRGSSAIYQERDWDGNLVRELKDTREGYRAHHDFLKIWNKKLNAPTLLMVSARTITHEQGIAAGCDPKLRNSYRSGPDGPISVKEGGETGFTLILWITMKLWIRLLSTIRLTVSSMLSTTEVRLSPGIL
jgi:hypothetical protein